MADPPAKDQLLMSRPQFFPPLLRMRMFLPALRMPP